MPLILLPYRLLRLANWKAYQVALSMSDLIRRKRLSLDASRPASMLSDYRRAILSGDPERIAPYTSNPILS